MKTVYVDLPEISDSSGNFKNVACFTGGDAVIEAVEWLRGIFGKEAISDEGAVCLITLGGDDDYLESQGS